MTLILNMTNFGSSLVKSVCPCNKNASSSKMKWKTSIVSYMKSRWQFVGIACSFLSGFHGRSHMKPTHWSPLCESHEVTMKSPACHAKSRQVVTTTWIGWTTSWRSRKAGVLYRAEAGSSISMDHGCQRVILISRSTWRYGQLRSVQNPLLVDD
jgi:hypothetical protein